MGWFSKKKEEKPVQQIVFALQLPNWKSEIDSYRGMPSYDYSERIEVTRDKVAEFERQYYKIKEAELLKERTSKLYTDAYIFYQKELARKISVGKHILEHTDTVTYGYLEETNKVYQWSNDSQVIYTKVADSSIVRGQVIPQLSGVWLEDMHIPKEVYEYFMDKIKCK